MVRWRTGCEGRISCANRDFGLARTRLDGIEGARTWCGHGVFVYNLVKVSLLLERLSADSCIGSEPRRAKLLSLG